jgi:hypothetical protein
LDQDENGWCDLCGFALEEVPKLSLGDINGDGKINIGDAARLYGHVRGTSQLTDEKLTDYADLSGDGKVNIGDVAGLYSQIRNGL